MAADGRRTVCAIRYIRRGQQIGRMRCRERTKGLKGLIVSSLANTISFEDRRGLDETLVAQAHGERPQISGGVSRHGHVAARTRSASSSPIREPSAGKSLDATRRKDGKGYGSG